MRPRLAPFVSPDNWRDWRESEVEDEMQRKRLVPEGVFEDLELRGFLGRCSADVLSSSTPVDISVQFFS